MTSSLAPLPDLFYLKGFAGEQATYRPFRSVRAYESTALRLHTRACINRARGLYRDQMARGARTLPSCQFVTADPSIGEAVPRTVVDRSTFRPVVSYPALSSADPRKRPEDVMREMLEQIDIAPIPVEALTRERAPALFDDDFLEKAARLIVDNVKGGARPSMVLTDVLVDERQDVPWNRLGRPRDTLSWSHLNTNQDADVMLWGWTTDIGSLTIELRHTRFPSRVVQCELSTDAAMFIPGVVAAQYEWRVSPMEPIGDGTDAADIQADVLRDEAKRLGVYEITHQLATDRNVRARIMRNMFDIDGDADALGATVRGTTSRVVVQVTNYQNASPPFKPEGSSMTIQEYIQGLLVQRRLGEMPAWLGAPIPVRRGNPTAAIARDEAGGPGPSIKRIETAYGYVMRMRGHLDTQLCENALSMYARMERPAHVPMTDGVNSSYLNMTGIDPLYIGAIDALKRAVEEALAPLVDEHLPKLPNGKMMSFTAMHGVAVGFDTEIQEDLGRSAVPYDPTQPTVMVGLGTRRLWVHIGACNMCIRIRQGDIYIFSPGHNSSLVDLAFENDGTPVDDRRPTARDGFALTLGYTKSSEIERLRAFMRSVPISVSPIKLAYNRTFRPENQRDLMQIDAPLRGRPAAFGLGGGGGGGIRMGGGLGRGLWRHRPARPYWRPWRGGRRRGRWNTWLYSPNAYALLNAALLAHIITAGERERIEAARARADTEAYWREVAISLRAYHARTGKWPEDVMARLPPDFAAALRASAAIARVPAPA